MGTEDRHQLEQDIDSVVAAMMPGTAHRRTPRRVGVPAGAWPIRAARLRRATHGGSASSIRGSDHHSSAERHHADDHHGEMALGFIDADLVAIGSATSVRKAIDARRENRNVVSNTELMRLVAELDNSNAWAVGDSGACQRSQAPH